jgi:hypothetical protein
MYQYKNDFFKKYLEELKHKNGIPIFNHLFHLCGREKLPTLSLDDFPVSVFEISDTQQLPIKRNKISANESHVIIDLGENMPMIIQPCLLTAEENLTELKWLEQKYFDKIKLKKLEPSPL